MQHIAIYTRVSTRRQDTKSQKPDLKRWVSAYANDTPVRWYQDTSTGKNMNRPGWKRLDDALATGAVEKIVCWRLDRLGRTASGLTALFESLQQRGVGLVSIKDSLDLSTAAGRLMANVLASVAAYETEIRGERIAAGQSVARANGKRWGGSKPGRRVSSEKIETIHRLRKEKKGSSVSGCKVLRICDFRAVQIGVFPAWKSRKAGLWGGKTRRVPSLGED